MGQSGNEAVAVIAERRILVLVVGGLVVIAIAAIVGWVVTGFERRVERIPVGYSAEARRNSMLAAERFLAELRIPVESVAGREPLWNPPPPTDTLVVLGLGAMSEAREARLLSWIEHGGHLVVEALEISKANEPPRDFLAELGFRLIVERADPAPADEEDQRPASVELPGVSRPLRVSLQSGFSLAGRDDDQALVSLAGRARILRRQIGAGRLTVLSDSVFLTNTAIGDHDNAYLMAWLVEPEGRGKVWLLYDSEMPWLGALLWGIAPWALISAGVLSIVWLWSLGGRLGPLAEVPKRDRRDLIEHLEASGRFLWRHGRASELVESSRRRILRDWRRRHPDMAQIDGLTQAEVLASRAGESSELVHRALFAQAEDASGFVDQAALLQRLSEKPCRGEFIRPIAGAKGE